MKTRLFFVSTLLVVLTACSIARVSEPRADISISIYEKIPLAPNVVLTIETPIIAPGPNYVWIDGYWIWDARHRDYVWVQAHWETVPYTGAYWIPGYWEYYRNGYRWIDACWLPQNNHLHYGYHSGRYDYYGRPVYYTQPTTRASAGYSFTYDHRPEYRGRGYSSSPQFNSMPKNDRDNIRKEYRQSSAGTSTRSTRSASTANTKQETIRIREDNQGRGNTNSTRQQDVPNNNRSSDVRDSQTRSNGSARSTETRSTETRSSETRSSGTQPTETRPTETRSNSRNNESGNSSRQSESTRSSSQPSSGRR